MRIIGFAVLLSVFLLSTQHGHAYTAYSYAGPSELHANATWEHSAWPASTTVDGNYDGAALWLPIVGESLFIDFLQGPAVIDKMQIYVGDHYVRQFALFYTTDSVINSNSNWIQMQNIQILNSINATVADNNVSVTSNYDEFLISFKAIEATAVRYHHLDGYYLSNGTVYQQIKLNEITFDEGDLADNAVPEPTSMILLGLGVVGVIRRKIRK